MGVSILLLSLFSTFGTGDWLNGNGRRNSSCTILVHWFMVISTNDR